jgi:protein TonB
LVSAFECVNGHSGIAEWRARLYLCSIQTQICKAQLGGLQYRSCCGAAGCALINGHSKPKDMKRLFFCLVVVLLSVQAAVAQNPRPELICFATVDDMPAYPGGIKALHDFLFANVKYPDSCVDGCIQGRVVVSFIVNPDSTCSDFKVIQSVDPLLDAEALRVLKLMPKWSPGRIDGQAVRVRFNIPINFRIPPEEIQKDSMKSAKTVNRARK